jgi:hypothetical protein
MKWTVQESGMPWQTNLCVLLEEESVHQHHLLLFGLLKMTENEERIVFF